MVERPRHYSAPLLADLLAAALDGAHLLIEYDSTSGRSERTIFPHGLYAAAGFWYCACYDYRRADNISLRADRVFSLQRVEGLAQPELIVVRDWLSVVETLVGREESGVRLYATLTSRGLKRFELAELTAWMSTADAGGGILDATIPRAEIEYYARIFLALGTEATVQAPPELIAAIRQQALAMLQQYPSPSIP